MYLEISLYKTNKFTNKLIARNLYNDGFRYHNNNNKWIKKGDEKEIKQLKKKYYRYGMSNTYNNEYARNRNYRNKFFQKYKYDKYRCAYCGKKLKKNKLVIDHIIPVNKVQNSFFARFLLKLISRNGVNDYNNLVVSCSKCNLKKGTKIKLKYILKGITGKYPCGITIRRLFKFITLLTIILYLSNIIFHMI